MTTVLPTKRNKQQLAAIQRSLRGMDASGSEATVDTTNDRAEVRGAEVDA